MLGCLIEKRFTTPDQYPLSLNALRLACNQATNRDPVTDYDEDDGSRGRPAADPLRRGAAGERPHEPRDQVPAPRGGGARTRSSAARRSVRAAAARRPDARRAEGPDRADGGVRIAGRRRAGARRTGRRTVTRSRVERRPGQKEDRFEQLLGARRPGLAERSRRPRLPASATSRRGTGGAARAEVDRLAAGEIAAATGAQEGA